MAIGRAQQPGAVAAFLVEGVGFLEAGDARPIGIARWDEDALALFLHVQPIIQAPNHQRADGAHLGDGLPGGGATFQAPFHRLGDGERLRHGEAHGGIDVDAVRGRLLDGGDAGLGHGDFHLHVRREFVKVERLRGDGFGVAIEDGIGLDG